MARRIEHRNTSTWSAERIHAALVDIDYLKERLARLGGGNTELVEHSTTGAEVRFQVRQGVRAEHLPALVRSVVGEDLMIDRSESWRQQDPSHWAGEVAAAISRVPGSITGSLWLRDLNASDDAGAQDRADRQPPVSEFVVRGTVRVNVPLVAGKIEELMVERLHVLLDAEANFTDEWLARGD